MAKRRTGAWNWLNGSVPGFPRLKERAALASSLRLHFLMLQVQPYLCRFSRTHYREARQAHKLDGNPAPKISELHLGFYSELGMH
jgi:hypothetical protein